MDQTLVLAVVLGVFATLAPLVVALARQALGRADVNRSTEFIRSAPPTEVRARRDPLNTDSTSSSRSAQLVVLETLNRSPSLDVAQLAAAAALAPSTAVGAVHDLVAAALVAKDDTSSTARYRITPDGQAFVRGSKTGHESWT